MNYVILAINVHAYDITTKLTGGYQVNHNE